MVPTIKKIKESDTCEYYHGGTYSQAVAVKQQLETEQNKLCKLHLNTQYGWIVEVRKDATWDEDTPPHQERRPYAKKGEKRQMMMSFRLDLDNLQWLQQQGNKGRYINELIAADRNKQGGQ